MKKKSYYKYAAISFLIAIGGIIVYHIAMNGSDDAYTQMVSDDYQNDAKHKIDGDHSFRRLGFYPINIERYDGDMK